MDHAASLGILLGSSLDFFPIAWPSLHVAQALSSSQSRSRFPFQHTLINPLSQFQVPFSLSLPSSVDLSISSLHKSSQESLRLSLSTFSSILPLECSHSIFLSVWWMAGPALLIYFYSFFRLTTKLSLSAPHTREIPRDSIQDQAFHTHTQDG